MAIVTVWSGAELRYRQCKRVSDALQHAKALHQPLPNASTHPPKHESGRVEHSWCRISRCCEELNPHLWAPILALILLPLPMGANLPERFESKPTCRQSQVVELERQLSNGGCLRTHSAARGFAVVWSGFGRQEAIKLILPESLSGAVGHSAETDALPSLSSC